MGQENLPHSSVVTHTWHSWLPCQMPMLVTGFHFEDNPPTIQTRLGGPSARTSWASLPGTCAWHRCGHAFPISPRSHMLPRLHGGSCFTAFGATLHAPVHSLGPAVGTPQGSPACCSPEGLVCITSLV